MFVGGNVPPPLVEISVNDRQFKPQTAKVTRAGQRVRYKIDASSTLNHLITCGDMQSPLLRPGHSWIMDTAHLDSGSSTEVQCEVTCMKMHVVMMEAEDKPASVEEKRAPVDESSSHGAGHEGDEALSEDDGVDEEMLDALRAKLNVSPTLHAQPAVASFGGAGEDGDDDDDDDAQFMAERVRHGAIKSKSRER
jgi:hypothetical protein